MTKKIKFALTVLTAVLWAFSVSSQTLKNPVKLNNINYNYSGNKNFTTKASPEEGKEFIVPPETIWLVNVNCEYCYLRVTKPAKYITNEGYEMDTDGNISWGFLPVVLYSGTTFV